MSLFEVIHMIESLGIKRVVKVFRAIPNGVFKVLPLTDDNDVLNMVAELPRNRNVHLYLVEQDHEFVSEPNDEHEPQTNDEPQLIDSDSDPNYEPVGKVTESGSEPNVETNVESGTYPNNEPVGSDAESGSESNVETNVESETDPNDETVGSDTESETKCASSFEEDDFSVDGEDDSETESAVHTPQFTEHSTQFETHFEEARVVIDNETEYSDSLHSVDESDSEHSCRKKRFQEFNTQIDMVHPMLKVGMIFANREVLKKAVINYGLQNRNIAEKYLHFFVSDKSFSIHSLHEAVKKDFICPVHQSKLYRGRDIAIGIIEGKHKDQYSRIYDYLGELRLSNPGTTTLCKLDERVFERLYICMQACKDGFKAGCRPIICLDGCHLKGYRGGHLLTAVGIDANDCIYPIAFAAVESECYSSWCWFVQLLGEDLDLNNSYHISFMSDRQKGLKEALAEYFPYSEHMFCVRHLYNNFEGKHKGKALKDSFWKAATSTYMREFQVALAEMESLSPKAFEWLKNVDPKFWSKSHFSTRSKCDMLLNNLCESFNKCVLEARSRPIITMLEGIRTKIMQRIAKKKAEADKWTGVLCPKIQKKLEAKTEMSNRCWPTHAGGNIYQVACGAHNQYGVNLEAHACSCRKWDLTGIPCPHAISVILMRE
ncbi:hypothetical protein GQ457_03G018840 [Hibiscus cannabinus]